MEDSTDSKSDSPDCQKSYMYQPSRSSNSKDKFTKEYFISKVLEKNNKSSIDYSDNIESVLEICGVSESIKLLINNSSSKHKVVDEQLADDSYSFQTRPKEQMRILSGALQDMERIKEIVVPDLMKATDIDPILLASLSVIAGIVKELSDGLLAWRTMPTFGLIDKFKSTYHGSVKHFQKTVISGIVLEKPDPLEVVSAPVIPDKKEEERTQFLVAIDDDDDIIDTDDIQDIDMVESKKDKKQSKSHTQVDVIGKPIVRSINADSDVQFFIVIPQDIGWNTVLAYLRHPHLRVGVENRQQFPPLTDDLDLANHVTLAGDISCYPSIIVNGVRGILLKCREGSKTEGGSFDAILRPLKLAIERGWPLKAVFLVGCCKSITSSIRIPEGTLILAKNCIEYMGLVEAHGIEYESREHIMSENNGCWSHAIDRSTGNYGFGRDCQFAPILSGNFVINDPRQAHALRDDLQPLPENTCIEEEANGLVTAVHCCHELTPLKPDVIILKGVCCNAGQQMRPDRQRECTYKSFSVILKAIIHESYQHNWSLL